MAEKAIITRSYNYNRWYYSVWFKGVRLQLCNTRREAELIKKEYDTKGCQYQRVEQ